MRPAVSMCPPHTRSPAWGSCLSACPPLASRRHRPSCGALAEASPHHLPLDQCRRPNGWHALRSRLLSVASRLHPAARCPTHLPFLLSQSHPSHVSVSRHVAGAIHSSLCPLWSVSILLFHLDSRVLPSCCLTAHLGGFQSLCQTRVSSCYIVCHRRAPSGLLFTRDLA